MKRLNFKLEGLGKILSKQQMKKIVGGYDECKNECETSMDCPIEPEYIEQNECKEMACAGSEIFKICER